MQLQLPSIELLQNQSWQIQSIPTSVSRWYADGSSSAGQVTKMRKWWDILCKEGPSYGYFLLHTKTVLNVKPEYKKLDMEDFEGTGLNKTSIQWTGVVKSISAIRK